MSDLTQLLNAAASIALHDLGAAIAPALVTVAQAKASPLTAPAAIGLQLLQSVESGALTLGMDETQELAQWTMGELQKYAALLATKAKIV